MGKWYEDVVGMHRDNEKGEKDFVGSNVVSFRYYKELRDLGLLKTKEQRKKDREKLAQLKRRREENDKVLRDLGLGKYKGKTTTTTK